MSSALYETDGTLVTNIIQSVISGYDTIKVVNRLLGGSFHIQTIGQSARIVNVNTATIYEEGKNIIDEYEATATPVKVVLDNKYYIGIIKEAPQWTRIRPGIYQTDLVLLVSEEGNA